LSPLRKEIQYQENRGTQEDVPMKTKEQIVNELQKLKPGLPYHDLTESEKAVAFNALYWVLDDN
jgi:hypothetical protein